MRASAAEGRTGCGTERPSQSGGFGLRGFAAELIGAVDSVRPAYAGGNRLFAEEYWDRLLARSSRRRTPGPSAFVGE
jgi:hypothetical protein